MNKRIDVVANFTKQDSVDVIGNEELVRNCLDFSYNRLVFPDGSMLKLLEPTDSGIYVGAKSRKGELGNSYYCFSDTAVYCNNREAEGLEEITKAYLKGMYHRYPELREEIKQTLVDNMEKRINEIKESEDPFSI